jgi:hypothetical protein
MAHALGNQKAEAMHVAKPLYWSVSGSPADDVARNQDLDFPPSNMSCPLDQGRSGPRRLEEKWWRSKERKEVFFNTPVHYAQGTH